MKGNDDADDANVHPEENMDINNAGFRAGKYRYGAAAGRNDHQKRTNLNLKWTRARGLAHPKRPDRGDWAESDGGVRRSGHRRDGEVGPARWHRSARPPHAGTDGDDGAGR